MRTIIETGGRIRRRRRVRIRRALARVWRTLAGLPASPEDGGVTFRRVSRVGAAVRGVVPDPLIDDRRVRSMTAGLLAGSVHAAFALATIVLGLLARSSWTISVGAVIAGLNVGKSYLASGALAGGALDGGPESVTSLERCRVAGIALALAVLAMSGTVARLVVAGYGREYPGVLIYLFAGYALVQVSLALANLVRARREELVAVKGVRAFNLACALVSAFALQTVLLSRVAWDELPVRIPRSMVEGAVGAAACLAMAALGVWLARTARLELDERRGAARLRLRPRVVPRRRRGSSATAAGAPRSRRG